MGVISYKYPFEGVEEKGKRSVWNKGKKVVQKGKEFDEKIWRYDICGNVMKYSEHGDTNTKYGWEIDHIKPSSKGGSDNLDNLQPMYWENNRKKSDTFPWSC